MSTGWRKRGGGMNKQSDSVEQSDSVGEPVAWIEHHKGGDNLNWEEVNHPYAKATPLYTAPQPVTESYKRKPLTDEQIWQLVNDCTIGGDLHADKFAKAIEAAHGIKGEA